MTSFSVAFPTILVLSIASVPCFASPNFNQLPQATVHDVTDSRASADEDTAGIIYVGLKDFAELAALKSVPAHLREQKIASLRSAFSALLRENRVVVSDALILLLEVILLNDQQSAQALVRRYGRAGLPAAIQDIVRFKDAKRIAELSGQSATGRAGVVIRLHPLWWNGPQCRVAISGRLVSATETPILGPGESFYAQRVCDNPADNRLAQGSVPTGKETLYIAFRESLDATQDSQDAFLPQARSAFNTQANTAKKLQRNASGFSLVAAPSESNALRAGGIGIFSGIARARLGSGKQRPSDPTNPGSVFAIHGLRLFVNDDWALVLQGANVLVAEKRWLPVGNETATDLQSKKSFPVKRFFSRVSLEYGKTFGPPLIQLRPTLGFGITSLSGGTHSLTQPQYLAPHCSVGLESSSSPLTKDLTFSIMPLVSVAPPPFSGVFAELLLGVTLVL